MSFELSTPIKVVALAGLLVALLAGAFATMTVLRRQHTTNGVQAPSARPSTSLKFSQTPKKAVVRPVTVAATQDASAIIQRGLSPGETVVTDGQMSLAPGMSVSIHGQAAPGQARPGRARARPS